MYVCKLLNSHSDTFVFKYLQNDKPKCNYATTIKKQAVKNNVKVKFKIMNKIDVTAIVTASMSI